MNHSVPHDEGPIRRLPGPSRREVIDGLTAELDAGGVEGARYEAERMVAHVLGLSRTDLLLNANLAVVPEEAGRIASISRRRLSGVPLQHIEGTVAFRDLVLVCDGRALVPRPETEQLVQAVLDWACGTEASGGVAPDVELQVGVRHDEGLGVGVHRNELHTAHTGLDHAFYGVDADTTHTDHFDDGQIGMRG